MVALVVIASSLLQLIAGISALRLIIVSGKSLAWTLLSAGIMAMAFRRLHALYEMYPSGDLPSASRNE